MGGRASTTGWDDHAFGNARGLDGTDMAMDLSIKPSHATAYVLAGGATAVGFTALRHGSAPKALMLGAATGMVSGIVQSAVQNFTGSSELGWAAAAGGGAVAGAVLLGGLGRAGTTPIAARGIGAAIGAATGVFAPIIAGMALAQIEKATGGGSDQQAPGAPGGRTNTDPA